ncbi:Iron Transport-associated domain [uncultured Clostridium sp.]|uniref:NEAT domain-containing protein n=1 Tax=uncultured Clostridium sp. TaxID=59620 RepID=UPI00082241CE|nr:NEAT domain-containing protein [uncultured Clostridium sp.]SCJ71080.1 Iron Transport-associated domain [uncultured Clostridium sp.]
MKIFNKFKEVLMAVMALAMFFTLGTKTTFATKNDIASGIYELENDVYHESDTGIAMSRSYLVPTMSVEVRRDSTVYIISFSGSDYMENYRMKVNGEEVPVEVIEGNSEEGIVSLKVNVDKVDADMDALIYVGPMGRDVEFKVIPKLETLNLVEAIEEEVIEEESSQDSSEVVPTKNEEVEAVSGATSISTGKIMVTVGVIIVIIVVVIGGIVIIFKSKKR